MDKTLRLAIGLLIGLLAMSALAGPEDGKKQELQDLRSRIDKLKQEIEQAKEDHSDAADGLKKSEKRISDVNRALLQLKQRERKLVQRLEQLNDETSALEARRQEQEALLVELLRQRYYQGGADVAQLLLGGKDPNQIARNMEYFGYIGRARADLIRAYQESLTKLAKLRDQASANRENLNALKQERLEQKQDLVEERGTREKLLSSLSARIKTQRREVAVLVRNEQRLTRLIDRLAKLAAKPKVSRKLSTPGEKVDTVADASLAGLAFSRLRGRLALPLAGEIRARFGQTREGGGPAWKGLFIHSPAGREVRAVGSGEVAFADWLRGFGNLIIVDHGGGYLSLYSNNESLYKQPGDAVRAGDVVATVGSTGGQEEPGLYFELRHQGKPFDPMSWVGR